MPDRRQLCRIFRQSRFTGPFFSVKLPSVSMTAGWVAQHISRSSTAYLLVGRKFFILVTVEGVDAVRLGEAVTPVPDAVFKASEADSTELLGTSLGLLEAWCSALLKTARIFHALIFIMFKTGEDAVNHYLFKKRSVMAGATEPPPSGGDTTEAFRKRWAASTADSNLTLHGFRRFKTTHLLNLRFLENEIASMDHTLYQAGLSLGLTPSSADRLGLSHSKRDMHVPDIEDTITPKFILKLRNLIKEYGMFQHFQLALPRLMR
jgi:hypothetical protein